MCTCQHIEIMLTCTYRNKSYFPNLALHKFFNLFPLTSPDRSIHRLRNLEVQTLFHVSLRQATTGTLLYLRFELTVKQ